MHATQPHRVYPNNHFFTRKVGEKNYELTDHLGNVRATVTDRKIASFQYPQGGDWTITGFTADITSAQDYYPGGMMMPERKFDPDKYEYGFNGMRKDDEIKGTGNSYTTEFRQYDPRVFRWLSMDPVTHAELSPYNAFDNNPIYWIDPAGSNAGEYKAKWNEKSEKYERGEKISPLGDEDGIDFIHHSGGAHDGQTYIENQQSKEGIWSNATSLIQDYTLRDDNVGWSAILDEWDSHTGPEKSIFGGDSYLSKSIKKSRIFENAKDDYNDTEGGKQRIKGRFGLFGALFGKNMTEQMVGKAVFNFYPVGDKTVLVVSDSKSISSFTLMPDGDNVNIPRYEKVKVKRANTYQTYIFTVPTIDK